MTEDVNSLKSAFTEHEEYAEDTYAKQDGYYQDMAVGTAEQLVSSKFVEDQEPYTLRASGGSADIGNRENLTAIVGGTLAWNQQVRDEASDNVTEFADIVTVDDAVADNAGVKVKIEPVQDLHGYDHPWPAGGGKNVAKPLNNVAVIGITLSTDNLGKTTVSGTATSGGGRLALCSSPFSLQAGTYTMSHNGTGTWGDVLVISQNGGAAVAEVRSSLNSVTFTVAEETEFVVGISVTNGISYGGTLAPQIELGSTATAYAPYSNVCPISGWDGVKVTRTGKNVLDLSNVKLGTWNKWDIPNTLKPNTTYTYSVSNATYAYGLFMTSNHTETGDGVSVRLVTYISNNSVTFTTPANVGDYPWLILGGGNGNAGHADANFQIELGSTATDFEPYQGQIYSISIPSEAGTVYGGELTVNEDGTGQLVVDMASADLGTLAWEYSGNEGFFISRNLQTLAATWWGIGQLPNVLSSMYVGARWNEIASSVKNFAASAYSNQARVSNSNFTSASDFKTAMSGVQLVYELATPITYTLTASQVQTILGTNNVWSDAGQLSLTYKGTDEHLTLTDGRKYLTLINGVDSMVLGAGQAVTAVKGRDNVFDLTQMFGAADVADYVYTQGVNYFRGWFPKSLYAYNPGELKSVEGLQSHDTVGFNQWDEEWELGYYNLSTGAKETANDRIRSKNKISVVPNTSYCVLKPVYKPISRIIYYDANGDFLRSVDVIITGNDYTIITIPTDVYFINFNAGSTYGTTYKNDICIHLANNGSRNGEYEPYSKHSYPLDSSLTLRGIPKAGANGIYWDGDQYLPDGTVERRYGVVDLGTLTWTYRDNLKAFSAIYSDYAKPSTGTELPNVLSTAYATISIGTMIVNTNYNDFSICVGRQNTWDNYILVRDRRYTDAAAFKAAMSGVLLVYELATPTAETAEPYKDLQQVDDWGTEEFVTTGLVPVGHTTQYPANLRDKLQHLPDLASSNGIYIVKQTESEMELLRLPDMPTANGNYRLKLNVASGSPTFSWEVVT